ncbi:MAG: CoB--CoM heterodisulfide reductase iron-sulfur subunit A family protein [Candidatus Krumholzibacteriota bacterium]|nr:CoB--CoM heterodisulfide reductase iron-sulfur subunit A family protein [Candidatus Krumholzibacteriota bacterium]
MSNRKLSVDALVIGGGIAGLQAAIDLGDQGYQVLIVEKAPSIGGKMISLSKVFPTLDCSSCICTPRMAAASHHKNISIMTYAEVEATTRTHDGFEATVLQKPRYVMEDDCTGCRLCEFACPVELPHEFEGGLGARKAVYVPFNNAIPQIALVDLENCILCGRCEKVCPTKAINFLQEPERVTVEAGAVILATGYTLSDMSAKEQYGGGRLKNVLDGLQVERLLAPHGPYGRVLRPGDGKIPDSVAYVQCAGSRDRSLGVPYCSRVCCMYAIKQAMLLSGSLPLVDITIYYMDIRAFGKGFEQFYQNAKAMGIEFVKAKVAKITEDDQQNPVLRIEVMEEDGRVEERTHDMVVLSPAVLPGWDPSRAVLVDTDDEDGFVHCVQPKLAPGYTSQAGIFVAGNAAGPKDIPDSIVEAGAAAAEASAYLRGIGRRGYEPEPASGDRSALVGEVT